jgi:ankyrin repeat domain-containing protein 50
MLRSTIDTMDLDLFLPMLSAVGQEKHKSTIPSLNTDQPEFFWVFRNADFEQWSTASSQVLWLSAPPKCNIHQVSSYLVDQEKNRSLKRQNFVLYFFCSAATKETLVVVDFVHSLLHQIVRCSPIEKRILIVRRFLHSLLEGIFKKKESPNWEQQGFKKEDSLDSKIKKILNAPANELLAALGTIVGNEQQRELFLVVDGLDEVEHQKSDLIIAVRAFIERLQKSDLKVKALLTSKPQTKIKDLLAGLPCIEYDIERKGLDSTLCLDSKSN